MEIVKYGLSLDDKKHPCLVQESSSDYDRDALKSPGDVADMLSRCFGLDEKAEEHAYVVALSAKMRVLAVFEVSHGSVDRTALGGREIFTRLLLSGAACFAVAHNHPSGETAASAQDVDSCGELSRAAAMMGVPMMDFLIIARRHDGGFSYLSFLEAGMMPKERRKRRKCG